VTVDLAPALEQALTMVADAAAAAAEPWWIIGSAAVALHGADVTDIRDIDLLMGLADADWLVAQLGLSAEPESEHPQFSSQLFAVWREPLLPVEIFAGFKLRSGKGWTEVQPRTREPIAVGRRTLFVPAAEELHQLLLSFGRSKDLNRARSLSARARPPAAAPRPCRRRSSS
jgi:hypothetical protein